VAGVPHLLHAHAALLQLTISCVGACLVQDMHATARALDGCPDAFQSPKLPDYCKAVQSVAIVRGAIEAHAPCDSMHDMLGQLLSTLWEKSPIADCAHLPMSPGAGGIRATGGYREPAAFLAAVMRELLRAPEANAVCQELGGFFLYVQPHITGRVPQVFLLAASACLRHPGLNTCTSQQPKKVAKSSCLQEPPVKRVTTGAALLDEAVWSALARTLRTPASGMTQEPGIRRCNVLAKLVTTAPPSLSQLLQPAHAGRAFICAERLSGDSRAAAKFEAFALASRLDRDKVSMTTARDTASLSWSRCADNFPRDRVRVTLDPGTCYDRGDAHELGIAGFGMIAANAAALESWATTVRAWADEKHFSK
jgi:hypothetical protein